MFFIASIEIEQPCLLNEYSTTRPPSAISKTKAFAPDFAGLQAARTSTAESVFCKVHPSSTPAACSDYNLAKPEQRASNELDPVLAKSWQQVCSNG